MRRPRRASAVTALALLAGCARFENTPAQNRTWTAYETYRERLHSRLHVERIEADGRLKWAPVAQSDWGDYQQLNDCIVQERDRLRRTGR
jgi:hypothetical protein